MARLAALFVILSAMRAAVTVGFLIASALALPVAAAAHGPIGHQRFVRDGVTYDVHADPVTAFAPAIAAATGTTLPTTWCGTPRSTDVVDGEFGDPADAKIKVVEAYPSDGAPSAAARDELQRLVSEAVAHLGAESGGKRSLRFDLGTDCGPQFVDILTIELPWDTATANALCSNNAQSAIHEAVRSRLPAAPGPRNGSAYVTGLFCGGIAGVAEGPADDRPGPENDANLGTNVALTFVSGGRTFLHETAHTLGAVQASAPHHDGTRHCWDLDDVMCYPYTYAAPGQTPLRPCLAGAGLDPFDCNKDDYFSANPASGSYLDTHWNLFDSVFMCELATCSPAPEGEPGPSPTTEPTPDPPPAATPTPAPDPPADEEEQEEEAEPTPTPTPTPTAQPAPPAPAAPAPAPPPQAAHAAAPARAPARLSIAGRLRAGTLHVTGRIVPALCASGGEVRVTVQSRGRKRLERWVRLSPDCRFARRIRVRRRARLTVRATFPGNAELAAAKPVARAVR